MLSSGTLLADFLLHHLRLQFKNNNVVVDVVVVAGKDPLPFGPIFILFTLIHIINHMDLVSQILIILFL
jgi:hypothetical protein